MFKKLVKEEGSIHFKTDNTGLFEYTVGLLEKRDDAEVLKITRDFYTSPWKELHYGIKTRYEQIFSEKGEKIKYLHFKLHSDTGE